jgi:hypothetical protein
MNRCLSLRESSVAELARVPTRRSKVGSLATFPTNAAFGERKATNRRGAASLDYVLIICIVLPLAGIVFGIVPRMIDLTYHWASALVAWPFM